MRTTSSILSESRGSWAIGEVKNGKWFVALNGEVRGFTTTEREAVNLLKPYPIEWGEAHADFIEREADDTDVLHARPRHADPIGVRYDFGRRLVACL